MNQQPDQGETKMNEAPTINNFYEIHNQVDREKLKESFLKHANRIAIRYSFKPLTDTEFIESVAESFVKENE